MREHLSTVHPQKLAFVGERRKKNVFIDIDNPSKSIVKYMSVIDLVDKEKDKEIKVKLWKQDKALLNSEKSVDVKPSLQILNTYSLSNEGNVT